MQVDLVIHLEAVEGEACWWAESPSVPGFAAAGGTLAEVRERAGAALADALGGPVEMVERCEATAAAGSGLALAVRLR